jgi:hypothetical protein
MVKVQKIFKNIIPFMGISFTNDEFNRIEPARLIDNKIKISILTDYQLYNHHLRRFPVF